MIITHKNEKINILVYFMALINNTKPLSNDYLTYTINQIEINKINSILFTKYLSSYYKDNAFVEIKCLEIYIIYQVYYQ